MDGNASLTNPMKSNSADRLRVVITTDSPILNREILIPGTSEGELARYGQCDFIFNPNSPVEADYWIVYANGRSSDENHCAPENTLFVAAEPESKKVYPKKFYRQFHRIIDTHEKSEHPRVTLHAPCLNWHVGLNPEPRKFTLGYDQLAAMQCPSDPINKVSVVCSNANFTDGQRARLKFLSELKSELGDKIVHFGRGFEPIDDKLSAIYNYRFHLVLENCQLPHYWTEKLADAYVGWAYPLYVGSPNLNEYFPEHSFTQLSLDRPRDAAEKIKSMLEAPRTTEECDAIKAGRDLIMNEYNPWVAWAKWAEEYHVRTAKPKKLRIHSHKAFRPFPRNILYRLRNLKGVSHQE